MVAFTLWLGAVGFMLRETFKLQSSADQSTQMFAVIAVAFYGVPIAAVIALFYLLGHFPLRRWDVRNAFAYIAWGLALAVAFLMVLSLVVRAEQVPPDDRGALMGWTLAIGAFEGLIFWLFAILIP